MKLNLSKKLAISVLLLSLGLSQVACQSQSSKDDMFNQVGQSQEADKENRQNLKALEDFVGLKDIDSIKITLDEQIGGHDEKSPGGGAVRRGRGWEFGAGRWAS